MKAFWRQLEPLDKGVFILIASASFYLSCHIIAAIAF